MQKKVFFIHIIVFLLCLNMERDVISMIQRAKEYLDFAAGIAVNALGYHYPGYDEALKEQIDKLTAYFQSLLQ